MPDARASSLNIADVRWLIDCAEASGADAERVQRVAEQLVNALLDLQAWRDGDHDPRRQRTLHLARRVQRARAAGTEVWELAELFNRSEKSIYRLLSLSTSRDKSGRP